jgi:hypothetical protein
VLYQYDTQTGQLRWVRVGSVGGHISRNFLTDERGHVYVPRLRLRWNGEVGASPAAQPPVEVTLVEFDEQLREVAATALENYLPGQDLLSHGMTGIAHLADGSLLFTTHTGYLYRVVPSETGPALVQPLDWFHPAGESYAASLFPLDGHRYVAGVAKRADRPHEWVVYDLESGQSTALPFAYAGAGGSSLLYGSLTRDDEGACYVVGTRHDRPVLLRVQPAR